MRTWIILFTGLIVLLVYLLTIAPGPFWRDSAEFVMLPFNLDIGHPAGSPTYTMLAGSIARAPIGNIAFRSNLASTFLGVLAFFAFILAGKKMSRLAAPNLSPGVALSVSVFSVIPLSFSSGLWYWTVTAEVYTGMMAVLAFLIALSVGYSGNEKTMDRRILYSIGFLLGISCGLHMVMVLYTPAFFIFLFLTRKSDISPGKIIGFAFWFLAGFSVFLLLPVRAKTSPPFNYGNPETLNAFIAHITGQKYSDLLQSYPWHRIFENLGHLFWNILSQNTVIHALLATGGIFLVLIKSWRTALFMLLIIIGHLYLYVRDWKKDFGYLTIYLIVALLSVACLSSLLSYVLALRPKLKKTIVVLLVFFTLAVVLNQFFNNYQFCDRSDHDLVWKQSRSLLSTLPDDSMLISYEDYINYTTVYIQSIERWKEDVIHFHRAYLENPSYLKRKFSDLSVTSLDGKQYSYYRFMMDNMNSHMPYWDFGWEPEEKIYIENLSLRGRFWKVLGTPLADEDFIESMVKSNEILKSTIGKTMLDPLFNKNDWTALEVITRFWNKRAEFLLKIGKPDLARKSWSQALAISPDNGLIYSNLASVEMLNGNGRKALEYALKSTELDPLEYRLWNSYGSIALGLGMKNNAISAYGKSLKINKAQYKISYYLSKFLMEAKDITGSIKWSKNGLRYAKDPKWIYKLKVLLASSLLQQEKYSKALVVLMELAGENPGDEKLKFLIAKCKRKMVNPP